jgi:hypothetical protein
MGREEWVLAELGPLFSERDAREVIHISTTSLFSAIDVARACKILGIVSKEIILQMGDEAFIWNRSLPDMALIYKKALRSSL